MYVMYYKIYLKPKTDYHKTAIWKHFIVDRPGTKTWL